MPYYYILYYLYLYLLFITPGCLTVAAKKKRKTFRGKKKKIVDGRIFWKKYRQLRKIIIKKSARSLPLLGLLFSSTFPHVSLSLSPVACITVERSSRSTSSGAILVIINTTSTAILYIFSHHEWSSYDRPAQIITSCEFLAYFIARSWGGAGKKKKQNKKKKGRKFQTADRWRSQISKFQEGFITTL